jgi:hypothetical protein
MWSARVVWVLCFLAIGSILPPTTARATVGHPVMAAPAALPDIVSGQLVLSFSPDSDA